MSTLIAIHSALSNTAWLFFLILGLWGLFRAIRGQAVNGNYLGAAFIGQMIFVVQAVLGTILAIGGGPGGIGRPGISVLPRGLRPGGDRGPRPRATSVALPARPPAIEAGYPLPQLELAILTAELAVELIELQAPPGQLSHPHPAVQTEGIPGRGRGRRDQW